MNAPSRISPSSKTYPGLAVMLGSCLIMGIIRVAPAQTSRVQFIHASPYVEARSVDVYIDGVLKLDDFVYGSASPFMVLPVGSYLTIDITRGEAANNENPLFTCVSGAMAPYADAVPRSRRCKILGGMARLYPSEGWQQSGRGRTTQDAYLIILAGDPLFRDEQPGFDLFIRSGAYELSRKSPSIETIFFVATPSPTKVNISMLGAGGSQTVISNLGFGDFSGRYDIGPTIYDVDITTIDEDRKVSFVQDYRGQENRLAVNVVSGFDMRDSFTVFRDGVTVVSPMNCAFVQFIHNSPYPVADSIDIYVNDLLKIDNLSFREATPFIRLPSGLREGSAPSLKIELTRGSDPDNSDPFYRQDSRYMFDRNYVSVLAGDPERGQNGPPFEVFTYDQGRREAAVKGLVDLLLFHGSSDIPAIAVSLEGKMNLQLADHLGFGAFEAYKPLPPIDMTLLVGNVGDRKLVARFDAPLASMALQDSAVVVLTSDLLKSGKAGKHDFGLVAALPSGGKLVSLEATIPVPWWRSLWFVALVVIGLALVVTIGTQVYLHRLRVKARELSALVAERTKDLEAEKSKTEEQAERLMELDEAKNRIFANISHEFRTPLTLILGPLQDLMDGVYGEISGRAREQMHMMRRNAGDLLHLINQLLDLSRMDMAQMEVHLREVDLVAHIEELVQSFVPMAEHRRIKLAFGHDVPKQNFVSDPDMLDKVLGNLLSNALKFTPEGGKVWVTMNLLASDDTLNVEILVKDTGPGIPPEHLSRIFDRFASFDPGPRESASSAQGQEGIGIGLALAKELVELHNGVILVESEPGFGSTFIVRLPLSTTPPEVVGTVELPQGRDETVTPLEETVPGSGQPPASLAELESTEQKKATILIVDDNPDVRTYLRLHLGAEYRIVEATNGYEGLELAKKEVPDLVLADVMMPVMDGHEMCRALKADKGLRNVPVVMLTAKAAEADTLEGLKTGADEYIPKPFSMDELRVRVANLIDSRQQMRRQFSREILVQPAGIAVDAEEEVFLDRVREVIETHLGDTNFGVEWLASEVGMSARHLRRRLEAVTGEPPADLIRRLRLERASQLLTAHAGTVAEVAYDVGFKSPSHFSTAFRDAFGLSPSEHVRKETADHLAGDVDDP